MSPVCAPGLFFVAFGTAAKRHGCFGYVSAAIRLHYGIPAGTRPGVGRRMVHLAFCARFGKIKGHTSNVAMKVASTAPRPVPPCVRLRLGAQAGPGRASGNPLGGALPA